MDLFTSMKCMFLTTFLWFLCTAKMKLTFRMQSEAQVPFEDSVYQDQTAQDVQSDLGSTMSDKHFMPIHPPPPK